MGLDFRILIVFLLMPFVGLFAQADPFADDRVRMGFELELTINEFQILVPYIDFQDPGLRAQLLDVTSEAVLNTYLDRDPSLIDRFPRSIREELTEGLNLQTPELILPYPGGRVDEAPRSERPELASIGGILLTPEAERDVLRARWRALPALTKLALVDVGRFPIRTQAELLMVSIAEKENFVFDFRDEIAPDLKDLFESLRWSRDGEGVVELAPRDPYEKLEDYMRDRDRLLALINRPGQLGDHLDKPLSYHYHLSVEDEDLESRAKALNHLLLLQGLRMGYSDTALFDQREQVSFKGLREKGLLRLIASDRVEFRFHPGSPDLAREKYLRWFLMDEAQALQEIRAAIDELIMPGDFDRIAMHDPQAAKYLWGSEYFQDHISLAVIEAIAVRGVGEFNYFFEDDAFFLFEDPVRAEQIFWIFYRVQPDLLAEWFGGAAIRGRLSPQQLADLVARSEAEDGFYSLFHFYSADEIAAARANCAAQIKAFKSDEPVLSSFDDH